MRRSITQIQDRETREERLLKRQRIDEQDEAIEQEQADR